MRAQQTERQEQPVQPARSEGWGNLGDSLRRAWNKVGAEAVIAAVGLTLVGCSPQEKSYYSGTFTDLPPPPPEARLQLSVSTESDGTVFINYVTWDQKASTFTRKDIHYTSQKLFQTVNYGGFREAGGYKQPIHDGEVLTGGAIVDQTGHKILLPNGSAVDGPTGNIVGRNGEILKAFSGAK